MKQRYGTIIFSVIIIIGLILFVLTRTVKNNQENLTLLVDSATVQLFQDSLISLDSLYESRYAKKTNNALPALNRHIFDPNTADSIELLEQGFKPWQVRNMLKYRAKGGKWKTPQDLKKIYGVDSLFFAEIEPFILISESKQDTIAKDSILPHFIVKNDTIIEVNSADTSDLQNVKNIGPYIARLIFGYKTRLGGYYSVEQINEIDNLPAGSFEKFNQSLIADTSLVVKININKASVKQLSVHPYIRSQQAKQIYDYRREQIKISSLSELEQQNIFTREQWEKVRHYLTCE